MPKKPGDVELKVIKEMFEASVEGEPFDMDRWSQYYKPAGMSQATGDPVAKAKVADPEDAPWEEDTTNVAKAAPVAPKQEASPSANGGRAEDILAMIRNRQKQ